MGLAHRESFWYLNISSVSEYFIRPDEVGTPGVLIIEAQLYMYMYYLTFYCIDLYNI